MSEQLAEELRLGGGLKSVFYVHPDFWGNSIQFDKPAYGDEFSR